MPDFYKINKLTDCNWANLFEVRYKRKTQNEKSWIMCSRKDKSIDVADSKGETNNADAVVIVATIETSKGKKLVVTKEFRVPLWDFEYGFPAGLIDENEDVTKTVSRELREETGLEVAKIKHISTPVFSSAGLTDESCHMAIVEAKGQVSDKWLDGTEDIEVLLLEVEQIRELLTSNRKISAKAWGLLYHYAQTGQID